MNDDDLTKSKSVSYIKDNVRGLCEQFANVSRYPPAIEPSAYFMAGSPGAGKTEYSKSFIKALFDKDSVRRIVRIDADEIRDWVPYYNHANASLIQGAAALGVEKLLDHVMKVGQDFLLDGTFSNYEIAKRDIERCIRHKRKIGIHYLYQDPVIAWEFTKKRALLEGRNIPKIVHIQQFFQAKDTVNKIKSEFGKAVELFLIKKDFQQGIEKTEFNVDNVDSYIKMLYTPESLDSLLQ